VFEKKHGIKLGFMSMFVKVYLSRFVRLLVNHETFLASTKKAASEALQAQVSFLLLVDNNSTTGQQPAVNAVIDGGDIVYRDYVDVSVAVASPTGLVVPGIPTIDFIASLIPVRVCVCVCVWYI
jgi:hypothetical protein